MSYATLADLKQYLNITVTDDDGLLSRLLDAATRCIETYTRRRFAAVTETKTVRTAHGTYLFLPNDVTAVTAIVDAAGAPMDMLLVYPLHDVYPTRVLVHAAGWPVPVQVTARWGYSDTPPADIVHICIRLAAYLYRQKDAQVFDVIGQQSVGTTTLPSGVPTDVKQLLDAYRLREVVL